MWRIDTGFIRTLLGDVNRFVRDFLEWGLRHQGQTESELKKALEHASGPLGEVARRGRTLRQLLIESASCTELEQIKQVYEAMTVDYEGYLEWGASPVALSVDSEQFVQRAFDYFYKRLLDSETFWAFCGTDQCEGSKEEFRRLVGHVRPICPYCDVSNIAHENHSNVDHFLPFSYFPLLVVHWENLVVSCIGCNQYIKGKKPIGTHDGKRNYIPIFHPYLHQAADHLRFVFEQGEIRVEAVTEDWVNQERVRNYCNLFKIEDVYSRQVKSVDRIQREVRSAVERQLKRMPGKGKLSLDDLKCLYLEELRIQREHIHTGTGEFALTKFHLDYCSFLEEESNVQETAEYLAVQLGITFHLNQV